MVVAKNAITTQHGAISGKIQTTESNFYNLDAIISVGYRVNSKKATNFRIWATQQSKNLIRLFKNMKVFIRSKDRAHDRYIVLDKGVAGMKAYLCGGSSKDAGKHITTISRFRDVDIIKKTLNELLANPPLILK